MKYSEKLKDPRWQKKRLEIFQRDNWKCTECGNDQSTLHIHHEKYSGKPWEIPNKKLKTLCEGCHLKKSNIKIFDPFARILSERSKKILKDLKAHF